eukprot:m.61283 g.61283  ORF g.61283 m.61283 type:complete len:737 (-) comp11383_c0_seq7:137-2347(-)
MSLRKIDQKRFNKIVKSILKVAKDLLTPGNKTSKREWQYVFQDIHIISTGAAVVKGDGRQVLYDKLKELLQQHVDGILRAMDPLKGMELLSVYREKFKTYSIGSGYMNEPCRPLNKELKKASSAEVEFQDELKWTIEDLAMKLWKETVFDALQSKVVPELVDQIRIAREGNDIDDKMVADVLLSMIDMCSFMDEPTVVYIKLFENSLLESTNEYYRVRGEEFLNTHTIEEYVSWAHDITSKEIYRCNVVLPQFSQKKLLKQCLQTLALDKKDEFIKSAKDFLNENRDKELLKMFELLEKANALYVLTDPFMEVIIEKGKSNIQSLKANKEMTALTFYDKMRQLHEHYIRICERAFNKNSLFLACVDKACKIVMNIEKKKAPEFLAKVCDSSLKKSSKAPTTDALEDRLRYVVILFNYLQDKDIFQKFYSKYLAKRLIHGSSTSEEAEQGMIARLKALCGFEFTGKLQRMFTDVTVSQQLNSQFSSHMNSEAEASSSKSAANTSMNIIVAQRGAWPLSAANTPAVSLPNILATCMEKFSTFYTKKYNGRKLIWLHNLGTIDMKSTFGKKRIEFHSTVFQTIVLLMFNENQTITTTEVEAQTQLSTKDVESTINSLITCKLVKKNDDGSFYLNKKFRSKRHRVKINVVVQREVAVQEDKQTHTAIDGDRKLFLQAITVRCMKLRKSMRYNALVQEILQLSKSQFTPSIPSVKKCIEELIDKEYMSRDRKDRNLLFYVA